MKKVLLTAFEPFGGRATNASREVALALRNESFEGAALEILELPVDWVRAPEMLLEALSRSHPDILILLGEAWNRAALTPERVAINLDDFAIPDNAGHQPREQTILAGGPAAYFSTLPLVAIRAALEREAIPAAISNSAGTYLCNHVFYRAMHHLPPNGGAAQAGFLHVPLLQAESEVPSPGLPRETVVRGVRVAIETCLAHAVNSGF